jgi:hypothetical protein
LPRDLRGLPPRFFLGILIAVGSKFTIITKIKEGRKSWVESY